jgi:hypothetical protein
MKRWLRRSQRSRHQSRVSRDENVVTLTCSCTACTHGIDGRPHYNYPDSVFHIHKMIHVTFGRNPLLGYPIAGIPYRPASTMRLKFA